MKILALLFSLSLGAAPIKENSVLDKRGFGIVNPIKSSLKSTKSISKILDPGKTQSDGSEAANNVPSTSVDEIKRPYSPSQIEPQAPKKPVAYYSGPEYYARKMLENWKIALKNYQDALDDLARNKEIHGDTSHMDSLQLEEAEIRVSNLKKIADSLHPQSQEVSLAKEAENLKINAEKIYKEAKRTQKLLWDKEDIPKYDDILQDIRRKKLFAEDLLDKAMVLRSQVMNAKRAQQLLSQNQERFRPK